MVNWVVGFGFPRQFSMFASYRLLSIRKSPHRPHTDTTTMLTDQRPVPPRSSFWRRLTGRN
jgi:hypothetical protein